ncbi:MAG: 3-hydroxyacyl-CoA dehydrogenase family protein [Armatimonadetes bacterium]|nr:3-hydroxyacyl-CoA dehydrogenase family protein [Armatimonadota bacterium]
MNIETVGVIGAGVMGGGIAQMFAERGIPVRLWDSSPAALGGAFRQIEGRLQKSASQGRLSPESVPKILALISGASGPGGFQDAGLIIEAVAEEMEAKSLLLAELSRSIPETTVIGTNTSSLSVTDLAAACRAPEWFLGIHFFNPPTRLELVEVIPHALTRPGLAESVCGFLRSCGKTPVVAKDSPGFIVNRLLLLMINEAARMVEEGVASPEDIDTAMRLGALHPAGPLAVADLIGLDICQHILKILHDRLDEDAYRPAQPIRQLVSSGKLGRKTGEGFFGAGREKG